MLLFDFDYPFANQNVLLFLCSYPMCMNKPIHDPPPPWKENIKDM
jgi:hypothetical protein